MKFAAVIFDLDGTVIRSEDLWGKAFRKVLLNLGVSVSESESHTTGVSVESNWRNLLVKYEIKTEKSIPELEIETYNEYEKLIPEITLNDGVSEFMDTLVENKTPLGLATSTKWETADKILKEFDLENYFESVTTGEEPPNPKPAPDIFLIASEKLGVNPVDCLVIEDSLSGVKAAKEAGMRVIAVNSEPTKAIENLADLIVDSFTGITLKAIDGIGED